MLKRILALMMLITSYQLVLAQNVGIGTTNPVNKLSVNGKVNITDSLGIGTTNPAGELQVKSKTITVNALDQQQTTNDGFFFPTFAWQSITAGLTGMLTKVDLFVGSPLGASPSSGIINIYNGEGISGTLLSTTNVTYQPGYAYQSFTLSNAVNIIAGNKYTIKLSAPVVTDLWIGSGAFNPYSGGICSENSSSDLQFKTYVTSSSITDALVVSNGNVGIGVANPSSKLEIAGNIRIVDGTQGAGKVLISDTNGLTSWATHAGLTNNGAVAGNTSYWNGTSWVTNSSNIYNNGGNVGIGTTSPANKLTVGGNADITGNVGIGTATPTNKLSVSGNADFAGNVGIGTATPTNKLTIAGNANITGRVGIGTTSPVGELQVKSINLSVSPIDQQQQNFPATYNGTTHWQSFTAGVTGLLSKVDLFVNSPLGGTSSPGTITIYDGEGITGNATMPQSVTFQSGIMNFQSFTLLNNVNVIAGNKYTVQFSCPSTTGVQWIGISHLNPYAGGITDLGSGSDYCFRTYVSAYTDALVISNDKVGIGTNVPSARLDIAGNIKIADGTQGAGKVLTSDANGLAIWAPPTLNSGGPNIGSTPYWNGVSWVSTSRNIYNNGGNVGIGTITPSAKLEIAGNIKIVDGTEGAGKVLTSDANGQASWAVPLGGINSGTGVGNTTYWDGTTWVVNSANIYNNGGNVGIGTKTPGNKLSVVGNADFTGNVGIGTNTPSANLDIVSSGTTGAAGLIMLNAPNLVAGNVTAIAQGKSASLANQAEWRFEYVGAGSLSNSHSFGFNGIQPFVYFTAGQNVGIGTANPQSKLHIKTGALALDDASQRFFVGGAPKWDIYGDNTQYYISRSGIGFDFVINMATGNVGINTTAPTAKLSVNGTANNSTGSWSVFSDARVKTINGDFTDGLNVINKIHPVKFNYNSNAPFKAEGQQIGIVAQELEKIAPYMVSQKGYANLKDLREVNNQAYVFLLINAVKELSTQNEKLNAELDLIKAKLGL